LFYLLEGLFTVNSLLPHEKFVEESTSRYQGVSKALITERFMQICHALVQIYQNTGYIKMQPLRGA